MLFLRPVFVGALLGALSCTQRSYAAPVSSQCSPWNLTCLIAEDKHDRHKAPCSRRLRVALVGAGQFARKAHLPSILFDAADCFQLSAVWSRTRSSAEELVKASERKRPVADGGERVRALWGRPGWEELLSSDVELLDIVLPIPDQAAYVMDALSCGVNVISEKPAAETAIRGMRMLASVVPAPDVANATIGALRACVAPSKRASSPGQWFVAENWRMEVPFRVAARVCELGALGRAVAFDGTSLSFVPNDHPLVQDTSWRAGAQGNWIVDVGVHMVAAMRLVLGVTVNGGSELAVRGAAASRIRPAFQPFDNFAAVLSVVGKGVSWDTEGVVGSWLFSLSAPPRGHPPEVSGLSNMELKVSGTNGSLLASRARLQLRGRDGRLVDSASGLAGYSVADALRAAALSLLRGRAHSSRTELTPAPVDPAEAVADLRVVEEIVHMGLASLQRDAKVAQLHVAGGSPQAAPARATESPEGEL